MKLLNKSEASRHLDITRQHMNYHTKKKGGEFPSFVHEKIETTEVDGESVEVCEVMVDVEDSMLLAIVSKIHNLTAKKSVRGVAPGYVEKKSRKTAKKATKKKVAKKVKKDPVAEIEERVERKRPLDMPASKKPMADLVEEAERAKCEQEIHKAAKLSNDLEVSRGRLISRELVADVMVNYLDSLSKEIMQMPVSVIQEISAGIEAGKSNIELVNDLRKHLSVAIANTKKTSINTMKRLMK